MLDRHEVSGTFFTLGWIASRHPAVVRRIASAGHEIASHGWHHQRVHSLTPEQFRDDVRRSREILEDVTGLPVLGYRAPSYSISDHTPWAHDILSEEGYQYSSSVAPIRHDHYGIPDSPRFAHYRGESQLLEIPVSTVTRGSRNIACGGGGWFRLYPYDLSRRWMQSINQSETQPVVFYCHPWEFDPNQPRQHGLDLRTRFRHYLNLHTMQPKVERLLSDMSWGRMDEIFLESAVAEPMALAANM